MTKTNKKVTKKDMFKAMLAYEVKLRTEKISLSSLNTKLSYLNAKMVEVINLHLINLKTKRLKQSFLKK